MKKKVVWLGRSKAKRRPASSSFASVTSAPPRMVIHNEGVDRHCPGSSHDFTWLADYVARNATFYSLLWCPDCGKMIQTAPFDKAARACKSGNLDGHGTSPNRYGVTIQVCVVGYGNRPFTASRMKNAHVLGQIVDSWGIRRALRKQWGVGSSRSAEQWKKGGIMGHCHSPGFGENHTDPSRIDPAKLRKAMWPKK